MKGPLFILIIACILGCVLGSSCPNANPNDQVPDDDALQACLNNGGLLLLDPGNPGYIINVGLNITKNGTSISSSGAPSMKATIIAGASLRLPMIQTVGITFDMTFTYLLIDGNKDARANVSVKICHTDGPGTNYLTSNLVLPGYSDVFTTYFVGWYSFYPFRFVQNVTIHDVDSINSPCGAGIILVGKNYEVYKCNISWNGWDTTARNNVQKLSFPVADGLNFAVCNNGYIHDNLVVDNGNMQIAVGTGRNCRVERNTIIQDKIVTINAINVWPTNVWSSTAFWWNPAPWDFMHTTIAGNVISNTNTVTGGARTGIAVSSYPWTNLSFPVNNAGLIYNNTVSGANVNLMVAGVFGGTIWGNKLFGATNSGGLTSQYCSTPQNYTVGVTNGTMLQPGYSVLSYSQSIRCFPTNETIESTVDNARLTGWSLNGIPEPLNVSGPAGSSWPVSVSFQNTGTSSWQDFAGGYGYKVGLVGATNWGVTRATLDNAILYPKSDYTFRFTISLPTTPGNYTIQFQMIQEPIGWFGARSPIIGISVTPSTSASTTATSDASSASTSTSSDSVSTSTSTSPSPSTSTTSKSGSTTSGNGKTLYFYAYSTSDCSSEVTQYAKLSTGCQTLFASYASVSLSSNVVTSCQADSACNEVTSTCATYQIDQCFQTGSTSAKYSLTGSHNPTSSASRSFDLCAVALVVAVACFLMV